MLPNPAPITPKETANAPRATPRPLTIPELKSKYNPKASAGNLTELNISKAKLFLGLVRFLMMSDEIQTSIRSSSDRRMMVIKKDKKCSLR